MLDHFSKEEILKAISLRDKNHPRATMELSGNIDLNSLREFLIPGIDAISTGKITYAPSPVDISLKYKKIKG